jgi:predicted nucleotidyltransferase
MPLVAAPDRPLHVGAILRALVENQVEFVVVGGIAVQAHGYLRSTGDLDIVPRPSLLNLSRLAEALAELEAKVMRATSPVNITDPQLLKRAPLVPLLTQSGRLDLLNIDHTAGAPSSYEDLRSRALVLEYQGFEVPVAGLDDLIRMKRAAGRPQDVTDIASLTRTDEELEREAREST